MGNRVCACGGGIGSKLGWDLKPYSFLFIYLLFGGSGVRT
jgi:hypothetical protein